MPGNVVQTVLKYVVDDASVKKAVASSQQVAAANKTAATTVNDVFAKAFAEGKTSSDVLSTALGRQVNTVEDMTAAYAALEKQINGTASAAQSVAGSTAAAASSIDTFGLPTQQGIRTTGLGRLGNIVRFAGQAGLPGGREASGALELGGAATAMGVSIAAAGTAALIAAPLIAVAAVAVKSFSDEIDAGNKALSEAVKNVHDYYAEIAAGTTSDEARKNLAQAQRDKSAAEQTLAIDTAALNKQYAQSHDNVKPFSDALRSLGGPFISAGIIVENLGTRAVSASSGFDVLNKAVTDDQQALSDANAAIQTNTNLLANGALTTNDLSAAAADATKAQQQLADATRKAAQASIERAIQFNQDIFSQQRDPNAGSLTKRLEALDDERKALEQSLPFLEKHKDDSDEAQASFVKATSRLRELSVQFLRLTTDVAPGAIKAVGDQLIQDIADIQAGAAAKVADILANEAAAEQKALDDKNTALRDADKKAGDASVKLAQDTADKRAKIEREYSRSSAEAIQSRDAVALDRAQTKRTDDLADLNQSIKEQKAAIKKSLKDQQASIEAAYQKQLGTVREAAQKQIDAVYKQATTEIALKNQAAHLTLVNLANALAEEQAIRDAANAAHLAATANAIARERALNAIIQAGSPGVIGSAVGSALGIPGFAQGGMVPRTGLIFAHRGERVMTVQQQKTIGGHTINVNGMNERQVVTLVKRAMRQYNAGLKAAS